jgi:hypothetical protein
MTRLGAELSPGALAQRGRQCGEATWHMAVCRKPAAMVQGIKELLNEGTGGTRGERLEVERSILTDRLKPARPREGLKGFLDRKGRRR